MDHDESRLIEAIKNSRWGYTFEKEVEAKVEVEDFVPVPNYGLFTIKVNDKCLLDNKCLVIAYLKDKYTMVRTGWLSEGDIDSDILDKGVIVVDNMDFIDNPSIKFTKEPIEEYALDSSGQKHRLPWKTDYSPVKIDKGSAFRPRRKSNRVKKSSFKSAQKRRNLKNKSKTTKRSRSPKPRRR
jgi:hypothetical protein